MKVMLVIQIKAFVKNFHNFFILFYCAMEGDVLLKIFVFSIKLKY